MKCKTISIVLLANIAVMVSPAHAGRIVSRAAGLASAPEFNAVAVGSNALELKITDTNVERNGYYLEAKADVLGKYRSIQRLSSTATSHLVKELEAGKEHCFYLRTYSGNGRLKKYSPRVEACAIPVIVKAPEANAPQPTVWVDDDGVDAKANGIESFYTVISTAITKSPKGSVIGVLPGTYNGIVNITKSMTVLAMKDRYTLVNPLSRPDNKDWPVVIIPPNFSWANGVAIRNQKSVDGADPVPVRDVKLHGFLIKNAGFNGIQAAGNMSMPRITGLCENIVISGNRIENIGEDGIKVSQCNNVSIIGNAIVDFDRRAAREVEQGIDFVAVGNAVIQGNRIFAGGTGMTVKGGSIAVKIVNNEFTGPFRWRPLTAGEPSSDRYSFASSYVGVARYQARNVSVSGNTFSTKLGPAMFACQQCLVSNNVMATERVALISRPDSGVVQDVCIDPSIVLDLVDVSSSEISRTNCADFGKNWSPAKVIDRGGSIGFDIHE